jgi:hypothetical protein
VLRQSGLIDRYCFSDDQGDFEVALIEENGQPVWELTRCNVNDPEGSQAEEHHEQERHEQERRKQERHDQEREKKGRD